ncbi:rho family-interacting cell polarization regulator 1-like isoform X3 [Ptychodera flava]|uniref:rho family-interacting cell polarization regulator 1-like isoform X3 n=1 Tax=Ptychodera flava TaxID=63121 RepID=UPI00396A519E
MPVMDLKTNGASMLATVCLLFCFVSSTFSSTATGPTTEGGGPTGDTTAPNQTPGDPTTEGGEPTGDTNAPTQAPGDPTTEGSVATGLTSCTVLASMTVLLSLLARHVV